MEDMTAMTDTAMTVGQVAERFGVTVRTLHHYDEIGLLRPSDRSPAGYRLYTAADLERMQQVIVYRRLGFSLEEVTALVDGDADGVTHLRRQRDAVMSRIDELHGLVDAIDHALEKQMNDQTMTDAEMRELFGDAFSDEYQAEAEQRWGDSPQWAQSARRTSTYTKADWEAIKSEQDAIFAELVRVFREGGAADSTAAADAAEAHRAHIDRWYYECSAQFHAECLGELFAADSRYTDSMGASGLDGFGTWVRDAFRANLARR